MACNSNNGLVAAETLPSRSVSRSSRKTLYLNLCGALCGADPIGLSAPEVATTVTSNVTKVQACESSSIRPIPKTLLGEEFSPCTSSSPSPILSHLSDRQTHAMLLQLSGRLLSTACSPIQEGKPL